MKAALKSLIYRGRGGGKVTPFQFRMPEVKEGKKSSNKSGKGKEGRGENFLMAFAIERGKKSAQKKNGGRGYGKAIPPPYREKKKKGKRPYSFRGRREKKET